ncbi:MAG TPA: sugar ABC transporter ATP-binding protein, partial [Micromonospora sp.]
LSLVPEMSIAENLFLGTWPTGPVGIRRAEMLARATEALGLAGLGELDPRRTVASLSIATQQLVEIARALMHRPQLLILDEPTSSLAAAEVNLVLDVVKRLAAEGVAVIYVSHRMAEIRQIAETATVMRDGAIVDTFPVGDRSTADIVALMLGEAAAETVATGRFEPDREVVLSVRGLDVPPKLTGVDLELRRGEILGVSGVLGAGRSELLRALAGVEKVTAGRIEVFGTEVRRPTRARMQSLGIGFTPEGRKDEGIIGPLSVAENIVLTDWRSVRGPVGLSTSAVSGAAREIVRKLAVKTASPSTPIENLSGGNQQKAVIGRWLHAGSRIMLLDEPTRGVDVEAKAQIYDLVRALAAQGTSVVFVSSEVEELVAVCDRVVVLRGGRVAEEFRAPGIALDQLLTASIKEH